MLLRLLATIELRRLFSALLAHGVPPRSPPNSASACMPSSSDASRTSRSSGSGGTTFRFVLRVLEDGSLGLEEEDDGGRDSGGESSRSRTELDARLSVGAGTRVGGSGFLIFLLSNQVRSDVRGGARLVCSRVELWLCVIHALPHPSSAACRVDGRIKFLDKGVNLGGWGTRHSRSWQVSGNWRRWTGGSGCSR